MKREQQVCQGCLMRVSINILMQAGAVTPGDLNCFTGGIRVRKTPRDE